MTRLGHIGGEFADIDHLISAQNNPVKGFIVEEINLP